MEVMVLATTETPFEGAEKWERLQLPEVCFGMHSMSRGPSCTFHHN